MGEKPAINKELRRFMRGYLLLKGISLAEVGREAGTSRAMVSAVCGGVRRSKKAEAVLVKHGIQQSLLSSM